MIDTAELAYPSRRDGEPVVLERREPVVWGDGTGPLAAAELDAFDQRGFLAVERLLDDDELRDLEAELRRLALDPALAGSERLVREPDSDTVRSIFEVHALSDLFADLVADDRLAGPARQILGSDVYVHQSRVNIKPGLRGREFYWHSDFETWHLEDGLPRMRAVSVSISLTENRHDNGSLMIVPGSHRVFVGCVGETPENHYRQSLRAQHYGVPDDRTITELIASHGIETVLGGPGSAVLFDCNCMHGSNGNITPFARTNIFVVYNSVENAPVEPFGGTAPRPSFIAAREVRPLR